MILSMTTVDRIIGSAPFVSEGDPVQAIALAARLGYGGIELHATDPKAVKVDAIRRALDETGLALTALGTGRAYVNEGLSITDPDVDRRARAVARLRDFIDLAAGFSAKVIVGCMRGNLSREDELPAALDRLAASMTALDDCAGGAGVQIVFEPINRYENNFLCTMGEIADFIRKTGLKHTGLLIDTFHMNIEEADMTAAIRACAPEIQYVHLADSNRRYPGAGHTDLKAVLDALKAADYTGPLSAEILPKPTPLAAAQNWLTATKALLAEG